MSSVSKRLREYGRLMKADQPLTIIPTLQNSIEDFVRVAPNDRARGKVLNYYAMYHYQSGHNETALEHFRRSFELTGETEALRNGLIISRKCRKSASLEVLHRAAMKLIREMTDSVEKADLYDVLCHNAGAGGDLQSASDFGKESLRIKDQLAMKAVALSDQKKPNFDFFNPKRNVISFSLFGDNSRYTQTALQNAQAVVHVYPGWSCRFYMDGSVPHSVKEQLVELGADVRVVQKPHDRKTMSGLFWRFLVAQEQDIDFFLVRDADSLISVREKVAVDVWLQSSKRFHAMRDFYTHSELLLAGLWGGVGGCLTNIGEEIESFHKAKRPGILGSANLDQLFLRHHVWPAVKEDLLQHDSIFCAPGSVDFPPLGLIHPNRHVGQDINVFRG